MVEQVKDVSILQAVYVILEHEKKDEETVLIFTIRWIRYCKHPFSAD